MESIAVIADIHGNYVALEAVLDDLARNPAEGLVCLGDAIQGGAQPAQVVQRLRELGCPVVMGNADAWLLTGKDTSPAEVTTEKQARVREWQLAQLSQDDKDFIAAFSPTVEVELEGGVKLLCFHGSPTSFDDVMLPETLEEEFLGFVGDWKGQVLAGAHTHLQQIRRLDKYFFFNPGSVGVAYNRNQPEENFQMDHWAEYAVLRAHQGGVSLEFRRVPINVEKLIDVLTTSGRPYGEDNAKQYRGRTA